MKLENADRKILRHSIATVAYRGAKTLRNAPDGFGGFKIGESTKTPLEILGHIGDLFDWALSLVAGKESWDDTNPLPWDQEIERFFFSLRLFDDYLKSNGPFFVSAERLFQGPIADALTHIGQIAMLRRLYGLPIKGENYFKAEIQTGRFELEQSDPSHEFD